ncbi:MAG: PRC-barrel domain-containing protein [Pseudomonadota bacterium]|nr:PRC-barrel domain-containing protein [Pseudomonadota bacterium]
MLKMHLAAGLAATALMTAAAVAQTSTTTAPPASTGGASSTMGTSGSTGGSTGSAAAGQLMTQMQPDMIRGSRLMGTDIYGSDNQKIGDVDDVILDRQGKIQAVVVGVGGFLGIGEKNVAIPFNRVQWMSSQEVQAQNNQNSGTNTAGAGGTAGSGTNNAGGMTTASGGASQPATTGSTGGGTNAGASGGNNDSAPARGMVQMTKADLQNAPEFRFNNDNNRSNASGGGAGTNPPPASANRPGNAPAQ